MRQCVLERVLEDRVEQTTLWLDDSKLKVGVTLTLSGSDIVWTLKSMSESRLDSGYVNDRSRDYLRMREASDI